MTTDSQSGERPADGGRGSRRLRALRRGGLRLAAASSALCIAAGAGISMAGQASAAVAPAVSVAAAHPAGGHPLPPPVHKRKKIKHGIITKVFTSRLVKVNGVKSRFHRTVKKAIAFCPPGWAATGGGFLDLSQRLTVIGSFPFPSHPWATPVAWVVLVKHKWFGPKSFSSRKPGFVKAFVVCTPKAHRKPFPRKPFHKKRHRRPVMHAAAAPAMARPGAGA
jgi:hypothetical protein